MDLGLQTIAVVTVVAAFAGAVGWFLHRTGEAARQSIIEAHSREEVNAARRARDRAREETEELRERFEAAKGEHEESRMRAATLEAALRKTRMSMDGSGDELERRQARVEQLEEILLERTAETNRLQEALTARDGVVVDAERRGTESEKLVGGLRREIDRQKAAISERDVRLDELEIKLQDREATIGSLSAELGSHQSGIRNVKREKELTVSKLSGLKKRMDDRAAELSRLRSTKIELETLLREKDSTITTLRSSVDRQQIEEQKAAERLASSREETQAARDGLARAESRIEQLKSDLELARQAHEDEAHRARELDKRLKDIERLVASGQEQVRAMKSLRGELKQVEAAAEALRTQLVARGEEVEDLESRLGDARAAHERSAETVRDLAAQVEALTGTVAERDEELAALSPDWLLDRSDGEPDDLKTLAGVGPVLEERLNALGIFHFLQLAQARAVDLDWIAARINQSSAQVRRHRWPAQAKSRARKR
ncbi:MAG: hypothetical protein GY716_00840 [bacterium]|nr:hypothetical protein [bacterium]